MANKRTVLIVGRIAHDKNAEYWTPWFSFPTITAYRKWCAAWRRMKGFRAKADYHYVDTTWTADSLLKYQQREEERKTK